ncbi:CG18371 [Drosophila busckii]|uniref:acylphosphatase n=1 Tax=Drosophila busckii TaxID=30019 RepID=A0A0M3QYD1_DROBS|nr:acylphosphatase-1 [Drosophila busckii]ALC47409.1 CG18371 [Drosophila busckii]
MSAVFSCEFEVFGKVQGVYFRRHAERKAKTLGLRGWCMNTDNNSVKGYIEGPRTEMNVMKEWLKTTGSPASSIHRAEFSEEREKREYGFKNFEIREDPQTANSRRSSIAPEKTNEADAQPKQSEE